MHTANRDDAGHSKANVVDALLAGGADPCIRDAKGFIPYNVATEGGYIQHALARAGGSEDECWLRTGKGPLAEAQSAEDAEAQSAEDPLNLTREQWMQIQERLAAEGFDPGPADGVFGPRTRRAIGGWQGEAGDESTGYLTAGQAQALLEDGEEAGEPGSVAQSAEGNGGLAESGELQGDGGAGAGAAAGVAAAAAPVVVPEPLCSDFTEEAEWASFQNCWYEASNRPGCYMLRVAHPVIRYAIWAEVVSTIGEPLFNQPWPGPSWSGECVGGKASGRGVIKFDFVRENYRYGHGPLVAEGAYVDGKREGQWVERKGSGELLRRAEGSYVDGKREGQWVEYHYPGWRDGEGNAVAKGRYEADMRVGPWLTTGSYRGKAFCTKAVQEAKTIVDETC